MSLRAQGWGFVAGCILPVLLVYANSVGVPFHYDDIHSIVDNPHLRSLAQIPRYFRDPTTFSAIPANAMFRPLLLVSFAVNHAISGYQVWSYHLVDILLHALNALLVGTLALRLTRIRRVALLAALVFGLNPVNTESVDYISARSELLAGSWVLLGLWAYSRPQPDGRSRLLVVLAMAFGLLSKSQTIVLPVLLVLLHYSRQRDVARLEKGLFLVLGLLCAAYLAVVRTFLHHALGDAQVRPWADQIYTQVKALVFYLQLLVGPARLSVDHQFLLSVHWADPLVLGAGALIASLGWMAWRVRRDQPLYLLALGGACISLAPSSLIPLNVLVNEHRLYLPSAFLALPVGLWIHRATEACGRRSGPAEPGATGGHRRLSAEAVPIALLLSFGVLSIERNMMWQDGLRLWNDAASQAPLMARPQLILGQLLADAGRRDAAIDALERALKRDPSFAPGYVKLAGLYRDAGRPDRAEAVLNRALSEDPDAAEIWRAVAELMRADKRWAPCARAYARAVELSPADPGLLNDLGNAYQMLGQAARAQRAHERALALDSLDARTWLNLGNALLMQRRVRSALQAYRRSTELDSTYAPAWVSLGSAYERVGPPDSAAAAYRRGARLDPAYAPFVGQRLRALRGGGD